MPVENIAQRLRRLIDEAVNSGRFKSQAAFLEEAGVSNGYIQELEKRLRVNPMAGMTGKIARKIADTLGVSVEIVLFGRGTEEPPVIDKYPGRAWAISSARGLGISEAAIQVVLKEDPGTDPGRLFWFRRIEAEEERARPPADSGSHKI